MLGKIPEWLVNSCFLEMLVVALLDFDDFPDGFLVELTRLGGDMTLYWCPPSGLWEAYLAISGSVLRLLSLTPLLTSPLPSFVILLPEASVALLFCAC